MAHLYIREAIRGEEREGEDKAKRFCYAPAMDEGRKRTLLFAASILVARKLGDIDVKSPVMDNAIADAITPGERVLWKIDNRAPRPPDQRMTSNLDYPWKTKG